MVDFTVAARTRRRAGRRLARPSLDEVRGWVLAHPLIAVALVAFGARFLLAAAIARLSGGALFGDDARYIALAHQMADHNVGSWTAYEAELYTRTGSLLWPVTIMFKLSAHAAFPAQLYVAALGTGAAVLTTRLGLWFLDRRAALLAGAIVALLPSQILWSSLVMKDAVVWFLLVGVAVAVVVAQTQRGLRLAACYAAIVTMVVGLGFLRLHTMQIVLVALVLSSLLGPRDTRALRVGVATAMLLLVPLAFGMGLAGIAFLQNTGSLSERRAANAVGANTAVVAPQQAAPPVATPVPVQVAAVAPPAPLPVAAPAPLPVVPAAAAPAPIPVASVTALPPAQPACEPGAAPGALLAAHQANGPADASPQPAEASAELSHSVVASVILRVPAGDRARRAAALEQLGALFLARPSEGPAVAASAASVAEGAAQPPAAGAPVAPPASAGEPPAAPAPADEAAAAPAPAGEVPAAPALAGEAAAPASAGEAAAPALGGQPARASTTAAVPAARVVHHLTAPVEAPRPSSSGKSSHVQSARRGRPAPDRADRAQSVSPAARCGAPAPAAPEGAEPIAPRVPNTAPAPPEPVAPRVPNAAPTAPEGAAPAAPPPVATVPPAPPAPVISPQPPASVAPGGEGVLRYAPKGMSVIALRPLPWEAVAPGRAAGIRLAGAEDVFWYPILLLALGGLLTLRGRLRYMAFPVLVGAATAVMYGVTEGNVGTAYRHRGEFIWVTALLAAAAIQALASRCSRAPAGRRRRLGSRLQPRRAAGV